jgi:hypothetical protein
MRRWFGLGVAIMAAIVASPARGEPTAAGVDAGEVEQEGAGEPAAAGEACVPPCRSGYTCIAGECVEACNPPCPAGERCTAEGECHAASTTNDAERSDAHGVPPGGFAPSDDDEWLDDEEEPPPATKRKSTGAMITGIVLTGLGGTTALSGLYLLSLPEPECYTSSYDGGAQYCVGDDYSGMGTAFLIVGGVMAAVGVPLILYGSSRVPARRPLARRLVQPTLIVGPQSVRVRVTW